MSDLSKRFSLDYLVSSNKSKDAYKQGFKDCKEKVITILLKNAKEQPQRTDYIGSILEDVGKL